MEAKYLEQWLDSPLRHSACCATTYPPTCCTKTMPGPTPIFQERIDVRVSKRQRAEIDTAAAACGLSVSQFMRELVMGALDIYDEQENTDAQTK